MEDKSLHKFTGIYELEGHLATCNLNPGVRVYGEKLVEYEGLECRLWDPRRSKLAAAILKGLETFPVEVNSKILYLGASAGTTPSHISDIILDGMIYCVEFAPRMMRELLPVCRARENMIPLLEDAGKPQNYLKLMEKVDFIYSDVAQPNQTEIFMDNMRLYLKDEGQGMLMIKARSIDVARKPRQVFREEASKLKEHGFRVVDKVDLEPYEKDHRCLVCEFAF
ncbi:fibrillarin-like rRNA/tRNA 2'-O-methyltransferase [Methanobacterium ferruginis]|jgi:fibrillarin-like pre-rRNA processing protein|uniref:fibrillarin-like rRNA/tRNA 2'-O-methyltransferase n=1 Tax=Methanobacterium ferruginis TaxID=710191 RepID=UPI0025737B37|nr:fibrillarin-like rRNA/tRNA 2'-O-methyltransferase [Methanobacterium ferruginis]MCC7550239.1 fibrillarin-like rRNA/tRNA 2'-O-methyltransferase [Methanobacterium sp.]BDZ66921.1 fibrillarin-like rRNA methylase [Methanobacterium ferruginis]